MRFLTLFLLLFLSLTRTATGQIPEGQTNPIVESVEISGILESQITQALSDELQRLVGQRFDQGIADQLAQKIIVEMPDHVAAVRREPGSQSDRIKVIFVVARLGADTQDSNVNERYAVESVEISGIPESRVSWELRVDMQKLVGDRLDRKAAERLEHRLQIQLRPRYDVEMKVRRGNLARHVKVVYEARKTPWISFRSFPLLLVYHSKQGYSAGLDAKIQDHFVWGLFTDADSLLERYTGFRLGYENRRVGTDHVGLKFYYFSYHQKWNSNTVSALERSPGATSVYRSRRSFEPSVTVAPIPELKLGVGASLSEMEFQHPVEHSRTSMAGTGSLLYRRNWEDAHGGEHLFEGGYELRAATRRLDSDFIYTRHFWEGQYRYDRRRNTVIFDFQAGRLSGTPPLFERFSLGNSTTLRGWNKFDLAPIGANRLAYGSLEYRQGVLQVFYDAGTVWDQGSRVKTRHSAGFGIRGDQWFITIGVPIRSGRVQAILTMGIRN